MKKIPLTQGKFALVDDGDFERVSAFKWCFCNGYATRKQHIRYDGKKRIRKMVYMHRFIMETQDGLETDHRNRDKLDNRKENLRICTRNENGRNRTARGENNKSGYKGVSWSNPNRKWRVYIKVNNNNMYLGYFNDIIEAAKAYDIAAKKYHGDYANMNFNLLKK